MRVRLIVADEWKAHEAQIESYTRGMRPPGAPALARLRALAATLAGAPRPAGTVHAETLNLECPEGLPNCRNCGDPGSVEACRAAGHCEACGTRHGVAPDRVLEANGYRLEIVPD